MKYKRKLISIQLIILSILIAFPVLISAQEPNVEELSKQELKLLKLEEKVQKAKDKVAKTEIKIAEADSLIQVGAQMETEAKAEMAIIRTEEQAFIKDQNTRLKELAKRSKKASDDEQKEIDIKYKALDAEYKTQTKETEKRFSEQFKIMDKGIANQEKGREKHKQYDPVLKDAQKALELAEEELINYKNEFGFD